MRRVHLFALGFACALLLAILQLSQLYHLTRIGRQRLQAHAREELLADDCQLDCTLGGGAEPGLFANTAPPVMLTLTSNAEFILPSMNEKAVQRCTINRRGVLQLPKGIRQLAQTSEMPTPNTLFSAFEHFLPDGTVLRLPLPGTPSGLKMGTSSYADAACAADPGGNFGTSDGLGANSRSQLDSFASRLRTQLHMRCFLPAGTQLALPKTHFNQTHAVPQALSSRDPWFHQKNVMNSPQDGGAPAEAAGSKARSCAGRRHKLRIRRFTLARHGHQRHMKWVTAAAATSRMAVMRPGFGLAAASLERNRPWLLSPAFNTSADPPGSGFSKNEELPTVSVLFPLFLAQRVGLSDPPALRSLIHHLQSLQRKGNTGRGVVRSRGSISEGNENQGQSGVETVQLVLLGARPLCEESSSLVELVLSFPFIVHLTTDGDREQPDAFGRMRNATASASSVPSPFSSDVLVAWALLSPSGMRIFADSRSHLALGALRARMALLRDHGQCDVMFVPPGAALQMSSVAEGGGGGTRASRVDVLMLRPWHFFTALHHSSRSTSSTSSSGHVGTARTLQSDTPSSWLDVSDIVSARVPRGAWPVWRSGSNLPQECRVGLNGDSLRRALAASTRGKVGKARRPVAEDENDKAELLFWLGCMQAGSVLCLASSEGATTSADADSSADLIGTIDDEEMEVKRMADVGTQPKSEVRPEPEEGADVEVVPTAIRGDALPELKESARYAAFLRVVIISEHIPSRTKDARLLQVLSELAADGHAVTLVSRQHAESADDMAAFWDVGWRSHCPACVLPHSAHCGTCGEVQSEAFVRCRLQAARRAPHRVRVIDNDTYLERATALAADVTILWVTAMTATNSADFVVTQAARGATNVNGCKVPLAAELAIRRYTAAALRNVNRGGGNATRHMVDSPMPRLVAITDALHWTTRRSRVVSYSVERAGIGGGASNSGGGSIGDANGYEITGGNDVPCDETLESLRARELYVYSSTSLTLTMTDEDRAMLQRLRPGMSVRTLPFAVVQPRLLDLSTPFESRQPMVLFFAPPTIAFRRALRWMLRTVWPRVIADVPNAELALAGSKVWRLEAKRARDNALGGVIYIDDTADSTGKVARTSAPGTLGRKTATLDASNLLSARSSQQLLHDAMRTARVVASPVLLHPMATLRLAGGGAGSAGNMVSDTLAPGFLALSHAVPLVTTTHGARGLLSARTLGAVAIARSSKEFAAATVTLLSDSRAWTAQRDAAAKHVEAQLGLRRLHREIRSALWTVRGIDQLP